MKLQQLKELSEEELMAREKELRKELIALPEAEGVKARAIKREIARILTLLREKKSAGGA